MLDIGKWARKPGGPRGRPKAAKNKRTMEHEAAMREEAAQIEKSVDGAFEGIGLRCAKRGQNQQE
jgi:hypothetical protein